MVLSLPALTLAARWHWNGADCEQGKEGRSALAALDFERKSQPWVDMSADHGSIGLTGCVSIPLAR